MEPLNYIWWVLPQRLGGMRKPEPFEITHLAGAGVGAIISVMDDPSNLELYAQAGVPHLWLPTTGGQPPNPEQVQELVDFIDRQNGQGQAVAIHCNSGNRRTGTMVCAYLIRTGMPFAEALELVQSANPLADLRTAQREFLQTLAGETN